MHKSQKVARRKPKKQVQVDTQFIMSVDDDDEIGGVDDEDIDPELRGFAFGDSIRDLFAEQENYLTF